MSMPSSPRIRPLALALGIALSASLSVLQPAQAQTHGQDLYAGVQTVEVFANMAMQVTPVHSPHYTLAIYRLDAMQHIEALLNKDLPQNEAEAQRWVAQNEPRLRRQLRPMISGSVNGMARAQRYHIDRLPAVVINQRYVVFGHADVDQALLAWRQSSR